jgi:exosortase
MNNALLSETSVVHPGLMAPVERPGLILGLLVIVLYWCQLFYQIQVEWTANDQYAYGWFVPLLAAVLLWRRWIERPGLSGHSPQSKVQSLESKVQSPQSEVWGWPSWLGGGQWSVVILLFMLLPLRIIHEANVGWRSAQWLHAVILVALTLILVWRAGGWHWVRHFGFPVLFLLVAVPWPNRLEGFVVQGLMRLVAAVTAEVVGLFGVPAMQRGNLLEIGSGVVSVDGACSGVRSLQTSLMIALFLGELYRLRYWGRLALVPASLLIAFIANVGRTSFLTWGAARLGIARMESLHSSAGVAVVVIVFGLLWLTARLLARKSRTTDYGPVTTDHRPLTTDYGLRTTNHGPPATGHLPHAAFLCLLAALGWLLCIEAAAAVWFRIGDKRAETNQAWSINWPTAAPGYREAPLSKIESDMLRYDTAKSVAWLDEAGNRWGFMALRWGPDNKNSFIGRGHTPDLCFAGAGWKLVSEPAPVRVTVNGIELPFRRYVFEVGGLTAHAFLTLWDERSPGGRQETPFAYGLIRRLKAALQGKRHQGLKKLEISITGPASVDEALGLLQQKLGEMIVPEKAGE